MWRAVEWSAVLAVLGWLFVAMWSDKPFEPRGRRQRRAGSTADLRISPAPDLAEVVLPAERNGATAPAVEGRASGER